MNINQAHRRVNDLVDKFRTDLAFTAPELYDLKFVRFRENLEYLIDEIYEEEEEEEDD